MGYGHLFCLFHVDGDGLLVALPYCAQTGANYNKGISALTIPVGFGGYLHGL